MHSLGEYFYSIGFLCKLVHFVHLVHSLVHNPLQNLKWREVIQKHSDVSTTDPIRTPHEIYNEKDQQEPLEDVEDF